jgi:hypothetical protein
VDARAAEPPRDGPASPVDARAGADAGAPGWWKPTVGMTWDWQLTSPIDQTADVEVYDIDLFDNDAKVVAQLHAKGRKVVCYVNLGAYEDWRADAKDFPKSVIGDPYHGFPGENWLDIRKIDLLAPIVRARLDLAKQKGCDAVEPDNMNGYSTETHEPSGFPLTYDDQLKYNRFVAAEAHARGMAVALKNDLFQVKDLVADFDFSVNEQCFEYDECNYLVPFIAAGKPVFQAEYGLPLTKFCDEANRLKFSSIRKKEKLDAWRQACK